MDNPFQSACALLKKVSGKPLSRDERIAFSCKLATHLMWYTLSFKTRSLKKKEAWIAQMVKDTRGKELFMRMTDQCFRSTSSSRIADQMQFLIKKFGLPPFLNRREKIPLLLFERFGKAFPCLSVSLLKKEMRRRLDGVLVPEKKSKRDLFFERCKRKNIRINLNRLGEALLGEEEAKVRLNSYLLDLQNPLIECLSVKLSTLYSQINLIGFEHTLAKLSSKLRLLYRRAKENGKWINLDMEEHKDLDVTLALFQQVLSEPEFMNCTAGIVLQSYLPESFKAQMELTEWAKKRCRNGGATLHLRIVKGANLAVEIIESDLKNWEAPTFAKKSDTDANFKRMVDYALQPENASCLHVGIGTHNLFEIAYALILRSERNVEKFVTFEMLSGMAEAMQEAVLSVAGSLLLYCPVVEKKDIHSAIAYLFRRFDENSGPQNFLRSLFSLHPDEESWRLQNQYFLDSFQLIDTLPTDSKKSLFPKTDSFQNMPDTNFAFSENRKWARDLLLHWQEKNHSLIPLVISGESIERGEPKIGIDPARPDRILYKYVLADEKIIDKSLDVKELLPSFEDRFQLLGKVAELFRKNRSALIGAMIADSSKTISESDTEVSEAIDFIEYYRKQWKERLSDPSIDWSPKGIVLVLTPWNFPCSIAAGGIAAAFICGNHVVFKPAPETVLVGWIVANLFWEAGISKNILQFINCEETIGKYLITHPKVSAVILTGGTETAKKFLRWRPDLNLYGETGGKNAMIITALSDRELAIQDLIRSAFGHAGQKCSACSLAILEAEVYEDQKFLKQLKDAAASLKIAPAWNLASKITPLIRPPEGALKRALTELEPGESWLLEPKVDPFNPHLWSPGIKLNVQPQSYTHQTEFFGPILGIMKAKNLREAITFANSTPYGLTSGLHSLDEREHLFWKENIQAGNLYINRTITGAIVQRQPFGGCKASCIGSFAKAGGPNYLLQFAIPKKINLSEILEIPSISFPFFSLLNDQDKELLKKSCMSYARAIKKLKQPTDFSPRIGQDNFFYHISLEKAYLRIDQPRPLSLAQSVAAALICQTPLEISSPFFLALEQSILSFVQETEEVWINRMKQIQPERIRLLFSPSKAILASASEVSLILKSQPVYLHGEIELLHYLREVSLSINKHRYGYIQTT